VVSCQRGQRPEANETPAYPQPPFPRQTLKGLSFIHDEVKVVHTDLKPENILMNRPSEGVAPGGRPAGPSGEGFGVRTAGWGLASPWPASRSYRCAAAGVWEHHLVAASAQMLPTTESRPCTLIAVPTHRPSHPFTDSSAPPTAEDGIHTFREGGGGGGSGPSPVHGGHHRVSPAAGGGDWGEVRPETRRGWGFGREGMGVWPGS